VPGDDNQRIFLLHGFKVDGAALHADHKSYLQEIAKWMRGRPVPGWQVFVEAHASRTGAVPQDDTLSEDRYLVTRAFLETKLLEAGVDAGRLRMYGEGVGFRHSPLTREDPRARSVYVVVKPNPSPTPMIPWPPPFPPVPFPRRGSEGHEKDGSGTFTPHREIAELPGTFELEAPRSGGLSGKVMARARLAVPRMPGVTFAQLVAMHRPAACAEIPLAVLVALSAHESPGWDDATHGTVKNHWTSPPFYELGIFQTPAGLHGACTGGCPSSCAHPPPGVENPRDPSSWARWCKALGRVREDWLDPTTQVMVGLHDLESNARAVRQAKGVSDLFPTLESEWHVRAAFLLGFAGGAGYAAGWLRRFHDTLAAVPEGRRWAELRSRVVAAGTDRDRDMFANVDAKMALAASVDAMNLLDGPPIPGLRSPCGQAPTVAPAAAPQPAPNAPSASAPSGDAQRATDRAILIPWALQGERELDKLTDRLFFAYHPERNGQRIRPDEKGLAGEWLAMRERVRALLPSLPPPVRSAPANELEAEAGRSFESASNEAFGSEPAYELEDVSEQEVRDRKLPVPRRAVAHGYDRDAAVAYARKYAFRPCSDNFMFLDDRNTTAGFYVKLPTDAVVVKDDPDTDHVEAGGKTFVLSDGNSLTFRMMDDCTHFISCCIGRPPGDTAGGIKIPTTMWGDPAHGINPYGISRISTLLAFLKDRGLVKVVATNTTDKSQIKRLARGDLIAYFNVPRGEYTHLALYLGDDKIAAHTVSRLDEDWALGDDGTFRWTLFHFIV
jgi:hypothetical protein